MLYLRLTATLCTFWRNHKKCLVFYLSLTIIFSCSTERKWIRKAGRNDFCNICKLVISIRPNKMSHLTPDSSPSIKEGKRALLIEKRRVKENQIIKRAARSRPKYFYCYALIIIRDVNTNHDRALNGRKIQAWKRCACTALVCNYSLCHKDLYHAHL